MSEPRRMFTELHKAQVCAIVGIGCARRVAARYVGFSTGTIQRAAHRDEDFRRQLHTAEQQPRMTLVRSRGKDVGRLRALDEKAQQDILAILRLGCTRAAAAYFVGCAPGTIDRTARRNPRFLSDLRKAESSQEVSLMQRIRDAAALPQHWRAAAWALERKFPDRFGVRRPHTLTIAELRPLIRQFADILIQEVKSHAARRRIRCRMHALLKDMQSLARANR